MTRKKHLLLLLLIPIASFFFGGLVGNYFPHIKSRMISKINPWGATSTTNWKDGFSAIQIQSSVDGSLQPAYFIAASQHGSLKPLVVSLHEWRADYSQKDPLAGIAKSAGWNYIHPDFRGPNNTLDACLSKKALVDIDDAIQYAKDNGHVDKENIFVVGVSGGGYATLGSYLTTSHQIKAFLSWVPISDLPAWFHQSNSRKPKYAQDILQCTSGGPVLDQNKARERSPIFMEIPDKPKGRLEIYAGINDGYTGSVPISHSIQFFNRVVTHYGHTDSKVGEGDIVKLLTRGYERKSSSRKIGDRAVIYEKDTGFVSLVIFDGSHEMLPQYCFERLKQIAEHGEGPRLSGDKVLQEQ